MDLDKGYTYGTQWAKFYQLLFVVHSNRALVV